MEAEPPIRFPPFRLDLGNEQLWRGSQAITLRPKTFAVLRYLVAHPAQLVTKAALLDAVWPDTYVSEALVKDSIWELRKALGDDARAPRFIETVHRRGYRFIVPLTTTQPVKSKVQSLKSEPAPSPQPLTPSLVGREAELEQLHRWLEKALRGERQIVFVTGELGIGKTALVDAFLDQLAADGQVWIGRGQCIEHYGAGEAYLPVLEALGRLCRELGGKRLIELLAQQAPTWLVQMPALLSAAELEALQRKTQGATRERMLREMAEAVETLTTERALVLWLEDLHWSDYSTLDWLAFLARRRERVRLLVIGAYRPVETILSGHPLKVVKQELQVHGYCEELPLGLLSAAAVGEYLGAKFAVGVQHAAPLRRLARIIHQRTDGNPLFMVNIVDYLVAHRAIMQVDGQWELKVGSEEVVAGVPESLRQVIEQQIERLSPEDRWMLEAASVAGAEFSAAAIAAGAKAEVGEVEEQCEELARREQFLRARGMGEWPDETIAARYSFLHALYQEVLYERMPVGRRARLHRQIGEREEQAYSTRAREIAAELAMHFERGRDYRRAVQYLRQAGENALRRSAHQEAISHLTKGLELLKTLPDSPERAQQELTLQITLGTPLGATKGLAAPEVGAVYTRALELCQQVEETPQLFPARWGLWLFYMMRGELQTAREMAEQLLTLTQRIQDSELLLQAHHTLGPTLSWLGELALARAHLEQGIALYDPQQHFSHAFLYGGHDPGTCCQAIVARILWLLGYPDQALKRFYEALTRAQELSHPFSLANVLFLAARVHQFRREGQATQEQAEALVALCSEQGFAQFLASGTILRGWALAEQGQGEEGIAQIRQGLAAYQATGSDRGRSHDLVLLAEAYGKGGQAEEGLSALAEALAMVQKTGERYYEAELYRLKGQLTLQKFQVPGSKFQGQTRQKTKGKGQKAKITNPQSLTPNTQSEAEAYFHKAIEIARQQQAKSLELRAVMSLARLWQQQGKRKQARRMLAEVYGWFTEGFDTADLQEAKALLEELGG